MRFVTILCCIILLQYCTPPLQLISYHKRADDIYINTRLKQFVKENPSPKIVLRVLSTGDNGMSSTATNYNWIYTTIEKVLLKEGFVVRDRTLFNAVVDKNRGSDYATIRNNTDTDIIMEILKIDTAVLYTTDTVLLAYHKKQRKDVQQMHYQALGATIEYRLIMMKQNDITAGLSYYYAPCVDGCEAYSFTNAKNNEKKPVLKKIVPAERLSTFVEHTVADMTRQLRSQ